MSTADSQPRSDRLRPARIVIAMGVSSSGKSVVGEVMAERLGVPFLDGDRYHPPANKEKMRSGTPLTDEDRWPWLEALAVAVREVGKASGLVVGACSALKRSYRDYLAEKAGEPILFVHLHGPKELIESRIAKRKHEYMPSSLLDSQYETLELLAPDENGVQLGIEDSIEEIAERAAQLVRDVNARD